MTSSTSAKFAALFTLDPKKTFFCNLGSSLLVVLVLVLLGVGDRVLLKMEDSTSSENDSLQLPQLGNCDSVCLAYSCRRRPCLLLTLAQQGAIQDTQDTQDTQSEVAPIEETFDYPTSALPREVDVQDTSNPETPAPDTNLTLHINSADAPTDPPTIPSFLTVAERFADEFWTSAITSETAVTSPSPTPRAENAESPTDPFEFIPSPGCSEDDGNQSTGDLIEYHEEPCTTHANAEPEVEARVLDVEPVPHENGADKQIDKTSPLVPSGAPLDAAGTTDSLLTPESLSLAAQPTPSQEEVDEAWPAPSNDNMNAADTWGVGTTEAPATNPDDGWSSNNEATAAGPRGTETKGESPNNGGKGGGGWKVDTERGDNRGYGMSGFRRDRPFWQPPERDGGWEGFRKRGGYVGDSSYLCWDPPLFHYVDVHAAGLKAVIATIKSRVEAALIIPPGSRRTTIMDITTIPPIVQLLIPPIR